MRVRFAPSPTGYLHVGGYRTALYNYLLARKYGGKMILRIEDTDRTRLVDDAIENLIQALSWCGLEYDEGVYIDCEDNISQKGQYGPYIQSQRLDIYKKYAQKLVEQKDAYYCFCSKERLDNLRQEQAENKETPKYDKKCLHLTQKEISEKLEAGEEYVIRLNLPADTVIEFDDEVFGHISFNTNDIDDQVLIKSDGYPTYHFAVVIDDYLMKITHVIRGEEWISSTPKHIYLYKVLGLEAPKFVHLPTVLNTNRKKLSKRNDDAAVEDFKAKGYLPQALTNFVALLGWSSNEQDEIMSMDKLIENFDLSRISKSGAIFDVEKLNWMNASYIKEYDNYSLAKICMPFLKTPCSIEKLSLIIDAVKDKMVLLSDINNLSEPIFFKEKLSDESISLLLSEKSVIVLNQLKESIENADDLNSQAFQTIIRSIQTKCGIKGKDLYMPIRLAVTGEEHGADLAKIMAAIGSEELLRRIDEHIN
ncbi:MAG: glutamate--tRNA ligase [Eubacteriaceae bacterium]|nr:glutamate--tRNA ligase [Eubacteriaceae bacterium]